MQHSSNKLASDLRGLVTKLASIADALDAETEPNITIPASVRASVAAQTESRKCLQCGKTVSEKEPYRRGLCAKDYQKTMNWVIRGKTTYDALMVVGLIAVPGSSGRRPEKRTALDDFLAGENQPSPHDSPKMTEGVEKLKEILKESDSGNPPKRKRAKKEKS